MCRLARVGINDLIEHLDLQEVIACPQASQLSSSTVPRPIRNELRAGGLQPPPVLAQGSVVRGPEALAHRIPDPLLQHSVNLPAAQGQPPPLPCTSGNFSAERVDELPDPWPDVPLPLQFRPDQSDAASDVEPDPS